MMVILSSSHHSHDPQAVNLSTTAAGINPRSILLGSTLNRGTNFYQNRQFLRQKWTEIRFSSNLNKWIIIVGPAIVRVQGLDVKIGVFFTTLNLPTRKKLRVTPHFMDIDKRYRMRGHT